MELADTTNEILPTRWIVNGFAVLVTPMRTAENLDTLAVSAASAHFSFRIHLIISFPTQPSRSGAQWHVGELTNQPGFVIMTLRQLHGAVVSVMELPNPDYLLAKRDSMVLPT